MGSVFLVGLRRLRRAAFVFIFFSQLVLFAEGDGGLVEKPGGDERFRQLVVAEGALLLVVELLIGGVVHAVEADFYLLLVDGLGQHDGVHGDGGVEVDQLERRPVQLSLELTVD